MLLEGGLGRAYLTLVDRGDWCRKRDGHGLRLAFATPSLMFGRMIEDRYSSGYTWIRFEDVSCGVLMRGVM
jgi:hypothetical protein